MLRISIGMSIYSGDQFLVEAMECILSQDVSGFELIISESPSGKFMKEYDSASAFAAEA